MPAQIAPSQEKMSTLMSIVIGLAEISALMSIVMGLAEVNYKYAYHQSLYVA